MEFSLAYFSDTYKQNFPYVENISRYAEISTWEISKRRAIDKQRRHLSSCDIFFERRKISLFSM